MPAFLLAAFVAQFTSSPVAGGSGSAERIQAVIDACPATGCVVELPDADYPLDNQVWIADRSGVTIRSTGAKPAVLHWEDSLLVADSTGTAKLFRLRPPAGGGRPDLPAGWLRWPVTYKGGVGSVGDTTNPYSASGHQHNGMILVKRSRAVRIEGLVLDGVKPAVFANNAVWDGMYDVVHGSVGVGVVHSRDVAIAGCEIRRFWTAAYLNDRNMACASWIGGAGARPWSACGTMGGHLIERNRIHGNKFGLYFESSWDVGSVVRDNLAWDNWDRAKVQTGTTVTPKNMIHVAENSYGGGFFMEKDVVFAAHVVTRNTVSDTGSSRPFGWSGYRGAANALWSGNLVSLHAEPNAVATPLQDHAHVLSEASYPHVWDMGILSDVVGATGTAGADVVDSTLRWTERKAVEGSDSVDVRKDCKAGCWLYFETTYVGPTSAKTQIWNGRVAYAEPFEVRAILPDGEVRTVRAASPYVGDSTARFRLEEKDTSSCWGRNLVFSANARLRDDDTAAAAFLSLDTTSSGSRKLVRLLGTVPGARGSDGRVGQEPIRLRARGHGRWDRNRQELVLPVAIDGALSGVSRLAIRRQWIAARPLGARVVEFNGGDDAVERRVQPSSLPVVAPGDTVIRIPISGIGTDSLLQVDLWLAGIAGSDTVDATPMAWSVAVPMLPSETTTGTLRAPVRATWFRRGQFLYIDPRDARVSVEFTDARGTRVRLPVVGNAVDLSALRSGLWVPVLPGASPIMSTRTR